MATINPCVQFPRDEFFTQHKIKDTSEDYDYTRSFIIYATSKSTGVLTDDVTINIKPVNETVQDHGTPKTTKTWKQQLDALLRQQIPPIPLTSTIPFLGAAPKRSSNFSRRYYRTALDFSVMEKSCILIRLIGSFWTFSPTIAPVTTKHDYGTQYQNLQKHWLNPTTNVVEPPPADADYHCISFFTGTPCLDALNIQHGFSFNIEMVMTVLGEEKRLPITVDPDVENKGHN